MIDYCDMLLDLISNQFIWCLRLVKKVYKKIHDVKLVSMVLIAKKYPTFLSINLLSIFEFAFFEYYI